MKHYFLVEKWSSKTKFYGSFCESQPCQKEFQNFRIADISKIPLEIDVIPGCPKVNQNSIYCLNNFLVVMCLILTSLIAVEFAHAPFIGKIFSWYLSNVFPTKNVKKKSRVNMKHFVYCEQTDVKGSISMKRACKRRKYPIWRYQWTLPEVLLSSPLRLS
jgi:hypothetical protein